MGQSGTLTTEETIVACKNIGFDLTCGACASLFYTGTSPYQHDAACKTESAYDRKKWQEYERDYILPCFRWAKEVGVDLSELVSANPGHNCVELLVSWLVKRVPGPTSCKCVETPVGRYAHGHCWALHETKAVGHIRLVKGPVLPPYGDGDGEERLP